MNVYAFHRPDDSIIFHRAMTDQEAFAKNLALASDPKTKGYEWRLFDAPDDDVEIVLEMDDVEEMDPTGVWRREGHA